jgi:type IV secretion system protein VirD4
VAYAPNQYDTAELLSKMTGSTTVQKASFNFSGSRLSPMMNHVNASVDHIERPLMTPDEIMRLRPAVKEGHGPTERITAPGDMLIFVAGHYPIYGTQILYFRDPVLRSRAALAPPVKLVRLLAKNPTPFPGEDAPNVNGRDDGALRSSDAVLSPMERAFCAALSSTTRLPDHAQFTLAAASSRLPIPEAYLEEVDSKHVTDTPQHFEKEL